MRIGAGGHANFRVGGAYSAPLHLLGEQNVGYHAVPGFFLQGALLLARNLPTELLLGILVQFLVGGLVSSIRDGPAIHAAEVVGASARALAADVHAELEYDPPGKCYRQQQHHGLAGLASHASQHKAESTQSMGGTSRNGNPQTICVPDQAQARGLHGARSG